MIKGMAGRVLGVTCVAIAVLGWLVETRSPFSFAALLPVIPIGSQGDMALAGAGIVGEQPAATTQHVTYETLNLPHSLVHIVRIAPEAAVVIRPAVDLDGLDKVAVVAQREGAIAAINGGFFDPNNQQTVSSVTIAGTLVLDPAQNQDLMNNPNVTTYLPRILNRAEFRRYQCTMAEELVIRYAVAVRRQLIPTGCNLTDALGAGPALLPIFGGETEAFLDPATNRDALGAARPNARSGLGITADGTVVLVMAAQRPTVGDDPQPTGVSLLELAQIMKDLGVEQGMNLDGGSSSSLYYNGTTHYGRLDAEGNEIRRSVKSILVVTPLANTSD
ncbi:MAG: phosphodiester glycosidase family protein [Leptolyngbyaceae bacterium]|nr:phosphodiester glycosidase family protein [Leptolyngbyaceae bacterium]